MKNDKDKKMERKILSQSRHCGKQVLFGLVRKKMKTSWSWKHLKNWKGEHFQLDWLAMRMVLQVLEELQTGRNNFWNEEMMVGYP